LVVVHKIKNASYVYILILLAYGLGRLRKSSGHAGCVATFVRENHHGGRKCTVATRSCCLHGI